MRFWAMIGVVFDTVVIIVLPHRLIAYDLYSVTITADSWIALLQNLDTRKRWIVRLPR